MQREIKKKFGGKMPFSIAFPQRNSVGKSEAGKISFPLTAPVVGKFHTIHPLLPIVGNFSHET